MTSLIRPNCLTEAEISERKKISKLGWATNFFWGLPKPMTSKKIRKKIEIGFGNSLLWGCRNLWQAKNQKKKIEIGFGNSLLWGCRTQFWTLKHWWFCYVNNLLFNSRLGCNWRLMDGCTYIHIWVPDGPIRRAFRRRNRKRRAICRNARWADAVGFEFHPSGYLLLPQSKIIITKVNFFVHFLIKAEKSEKKIEIGLGNQLFWGLPKPMTSLIHFII